HLVMHDLGEPIVLTSGNVSDEPVAFEDDDARDRLAALCDAFLTHDRPIHMRTDDSVARAVAGRPLLVRRARGYVPLPMRLPLAATRPVLACGGELKNTFCVVRRDEAFLSHHIGDLENYPTFRAFTDGIASFCRLLDVEPAVV